MAGRKRPSVKRMHGPRLPDKSFYTMGRSMASIHEGVAKRRGKGKKGGARKGSLSPKQKAALAAGRAKLAAKRGGSSVGGWYQEGAASYISTRKYRHPTKKGRRTASNGGARYGISAAAWGEMTRREHKAAVRAYQASHGPKMAVGATKTIHTKKSGGKKGTRYTIKITRTK